MLAHEAQRLARQRHVVGLCDGEGIEQQHRVVAQQSRVGDLELPTGDPQTLLDVLDAPSEWGPAHPG